MYKLMSVISIFIRQFYLPNPFECFGDMALVYNWIAEPFVHIISFALVGTVYKRGSAPTIGSILYLITYYIVISVLWILGQFSFAWWAISIMIILIVLISLLIRKISEDILW